MTTYNWLGGALDNALSWGPQSDPNNPVVPGISDLATISGAGTLTGSLGAEQATLNGTFDLQGSIVSFFDSIVTGGTLTIESGATFGGDGEQIQGATVDQLGGTSSADLSIAIQGGGTYKLEGGTTSAGEDETIGNAGLGGGAFVQTGGSNSASVIQVNIGSYELDAGTLSVGTSNEYIGDVAGQTGTFTQKGGTHTISGDLSIGFPGTGIFDLQGGSLTSAAEFIGQNGSGTFTQEGGTHTVSDRIVLGIDLTGGVQPLGTGSYALGGTGDLKVQTVFIGSDPNCTGTFNFNILNTDAATLEISGTGGFPGLIVGGEGTGTFTQGDGNLSTTVAVGFRTTGHGTYNFNAGHLTSTDEKVGATGTGTFNHEHGTNKVTGTGLIVGSASTATGTYNLDNGTLNAVSETIGDQGKGTFTQNGGSNTVTTHNLIVGNAAGGNGTYTLHNGSVTLQTGNLIIGSQASATGAFSFDTTAGDAGTLTITTGTITVGNAGTGTFTQGGGTLSADLKVGAQTGGHGTFELDSGSFASQSSSEIIGDHGTGIFTQMGGSNTVTTNDLIVGNAAGGDGTYTLHNGSLTIQTGGLTVGAQANSTGAFNFNTAGGDAGTLTITNGAVTIGDGGTGTFTQGGGELDANIEVGAQTGSEGTFELDNGTLVSQDSGETIGDAGTGTFTQKGGSNAINNGNLFVGDSGGSGTYTLGGTSSLTITGGVFDIAEGGGSTGVFNFNTAGGDAATLTIDSKLITVGVHGKATFTQGGGTLNAKIVVGGQVGSHGTFNLNGGTVSAAGQVVGNNGTGTFTQTAGTNKITSGGDLILGAFAAGGGTYNLKGGILTSGSELVGYAGAGHVTQTGGTNTLSAGNSILDVGVQTNAIGTYTLQQGSLKAIQEVIGDSGTGTFTQKGGTNTITGAGLDFDIGAQASGNGTYVLQATAALKAIQETVGDAGTGKFTQSGGTNTINGTGAKLTIGAQAASHGSYALTNGTLTATQEVVGDAGTGTFTQANGTNKISGTLDVGAASTGNGTYTLTKGSLTTGAEIVGDAGVGKFNQKGGTNVISGNLTIGNANGGVGTYALTGGSLTVKAITGHTDILTLGETAGSKGNLTVSHATLSAPDLIIGAGGTGAVTMGTGGIVKITHSLTIGSGSTLKSSAGAIDIGQISTATAGTIAVGTGGTLSGAGTVTATINETAHGIVEAQGGVLKIVGDIAGGGKLLIDDGATLDLTGDDSNSVMFKGGAGILKLETSATLTGKITNLQVGDVIDLVGVKAKHASIHAGVLTVTEKNGGPTLTFHVSGALTGNIFTIQSDGHGGSNLVFGPRPPASAIADDQADHFIFTSIDHATGSTHGADSGAALIANLAAHQMTLLTSATGAPHGDALLAIDANGYIVCQADDGLAFKLDHAVHLSAFNTTDFS